MDHLVRDGFTAEGYAFATHATDIARSRGFSRIARLASNENPSPPSPRALERAGAALAGSNRYPDERMHELRDALRAHHGEYHFVTGVGMDGVIETVIRVLVGPGDAVAISTPTFSFYRLAAEAQGGRVQYIPREADFTVDPDRFLQESRGSKLAFLCSPNNPTGNATEPAVIGEILDGIDGLLFLDNAYVEFSGIDYRPLMRRHDNLIIGRTFSKAFSLAGLRIGYAFVPEWFEPFYTRAATPFALNSVSAAAAVGALSDAAAVEKYLAQVRLWRQRFRDEIPFRTLPSDANFVCVDTAPFTGDEVVVRLAEQGVVVRSCSSFTGLGDHYIRVSIGEDWENKRFIDEISNL
jgi:histidinol-phosphate aminotransferase